MGLSLTAAAASGSRVAARHRSKSIGHATSMRQASGRWQLSWIASKQMNADLPGSAPLLLASHMHHTRAAAVAQHGETSV